MTLAPPEDPLAWLDQPLPKRHAGVAITDPGVSDAAAESPFIPGTRIQYAWDSTSLGWFKRCPQLYYYKMIEGWKRKNEDAIDLTFGILYHACLQNYDIHRTVDKVNHETAVRMALLTLLRDMADFQPDHAIKTRSNLVRTCIWYMDKFESDPATTVVLDNGQPAVEVSFRFELDFGPASSDHPYMLCGHLDRIVRYQDMEWVMDRKTTKYDPGQRYFKSYRPDNQVSLYALAARVVFGWDISGVIIDAAQIQVGATNFVRGPIARNQDELDEWLVDLKYYLDNAERCAVQGYWPKNDTSCDKYGGCEFRDICGMSPSSRDKFLASKHEKGEPWNPLKPR